MKVDTVVREGRVAKVDTVVREGRVAKCPPHEECHCDELQQGN